MITEFTESQVHQYREDGFLIIDNFLEAGELELLRTRIDGWLAGDRDMVLSADNENWRPGDDPNRHRLYTGLWKGDSGLGRHIFAGSYAKLIAQLQGLDSVRFWMDGLHVKPDGGKPLEMHQDGAVNFWLDPVGGFSCWIPLSDTYEDGGTLVYARGSHRWGAKQPPAERSQDLVAGRVGPDKWTKYFDEIAPAGTKVEMVPVVVKAGGAAFHTSWVWHGSGPNTRPGSVRRSYVVEMINGRARHHPVVRNPIFSRTVLPGETELDEKFFPILWSKDGYRTPWVDAYGLAEQEFVSCFSSDAMRLYEEGNGPIDVTPWDSVQPGSGTGER